MPAVKMKCEGEGFDYSLGFHCLIFGMRVYRKDIVVISNWVIGCFHSIKQTPAKC